jgi:hypothetical protein
MQQANGLRLTGRRYTLHHKRLSNNVLHSANSGCDGVEARGLILAGSEDYFSCYFCVSFLSLKDCFSLSEHGGAKHLLGPMVHIDASNTFEGAFHERPSVTTQKPLVNCPMRGLKRRKTVHLNLSYQHFWGSCGPVSCTVHNGSGDPNQ